MCIVPAFGWLTVGFLLISLNLSQEDILLLPLQGSDLCTDRCTLFSITHGADWIDFVKDSITLKETYNLTSDSILLSFYCRIFHPTHCFLSCHYIVHFLTLLHQQSYLLFIKQYALTGLGDGLGSEGRMCKWVIIAWRRSRSLESC